MRINHRWAWIVFTITSVMLIILSVQKRTPFSLVEVFGFVTGAICVLLAVNQNIWNFPIGIANNIFFIVLFLTSRLYGDMALQIIYIVLGIMGLWQWIYGGKNNTELCVSHASIRELVFLIVIGSAATFGLYKYFLKIKDAAPFLDALTTVISLVAQFLLNGKRIENWFFWIAADVIYIGLYIQKELYLTAILYAVFIGMCIAGLVSWRKAELEDKAEVAVL